VRYGNRLVMKDGYITNTQFGVGGGEETLPTHQAAAASSSSGVGAGFAGFLTSMRGMVGGGDSASSSSSATSTQTQGAPTTNTSSAGFVVRSPCALCLMAFSCWCVV
jgi:hypothetical protein